MATVNFSVPDEVRELFNRTFAGRNKSAIIAELMLRAVEEQQRLETRSRAIERLLAARAQAAPVTEAEIRTARECLRK